MFSLTGKALVRNSYNIQELACLYQSLYLKQFAPLVT